MEVNGWPITRHGLSGIGGPLVLNDVGLKKAIRDGSIRITSQSFTDDQIQPASLDMRVGRVKVFDSESVAKSQFQDTFVKKKPFSDMYEPTDEFAKVYPDEPDIPIDIPPESHVEMFFHETIKFDTEKYDLNVDLRSSRGRLGLTLHSRRLEESEEGEYLVFRNNNPNTVRLYGRDKFAQMFFYPRDESFSHDGFIVEEDKHAKEDATMICLEPFKMMGPYVMFGLGDHVLKFRKGLGVVDTKTKYSEDYLYEKHKTSGILNGNSLDLIVDSEAPIIAQLTPRLKLPSTVGLQLLHRYPYTHRSGMLHPDISVLFREDHITNAGWVDPGYGGNITVQQIRRRGKKALLKGELMALGMIFHYNVPAERPYGSASLKSHYQGSDGSGTRS